MQHTEDDDDLLRPGEVKARFGLSRITLINWEATGLLTALYTPGGHRRYRLGDLKRLVKPRNTEADD